MREPSAMPVPRPAPCAHSPPAGGTRAAHAGPPPRAARPPRGPIGCGRRRSAVTRRTRGTAAFLRSPRGGAERCGAVRLCPARCGAVLCGPPPVRRCPARPGSSRSVPFSPGPSRPAPVPPKFPASCPPRPVPPRPPPPAAFRSPDPVRCGAVRAGALPAERAPPPAASSSSSSRRSPPPGPGRALPEAPRAAPGGPTPVPPPLGSLARPSAAGGRGWRSSPRRALPAAPRPPLRALGRWALTPLLCPGGVRLPGGFLPSPWHAVPRFGVPPSTGCGPPELPSPARVPRAVFPGYSPLSWKVSSRQLQTPRIPAHPFPTGAAGTQRGASGELQVPAAPRCLRTSRPLPSKPGVFPLERTARRQGRGSPPLLPSEQSDFAGSMERQPRWHRNGPGNGAAAAAAGVVDVFLRRRMRVFGFVLVGSRSSAKNPTLKGLFEETAAGSESFQRFTSADAHMEWSRCFFAGRFAVSSSGVPRAHPKSTG